MPSKTLHLDLPAASTVACYMEVVEMPDLCFPAIVTREPGRMLLSVDPRSTRVDITAWTIEYLTVEERNIFRAAFDLPMDGQDTPFWITEDELSLLYVPAALRCEGDPAIQGGPAVLAERLETVGLDFEMWWLHAEMRGLMSASVAAG